MSWSWISGQEAANFGQFIGGVFSVITAIIALYAAVLAIRQLNAAAAQSAETVRLERESHAYQYWKEYLQLCVEYPNLARGTYPLPRLSQKVSEETERYEWFVAFMLNACEGIILFVSPKQDWKEAVQQQIDITAGTSQVLTSRRIERSIRRSFET